jgi:hypothetical protein
MEGRRARRLASLVSLHSASTVGTIRASFKLEPLSLELNHSNLITL